MTCNMWPSDRIRSVGLERLLLHLFKQKMTLFPQAHHLELYMENKHTKTNKNLSSYLSFKLSIWFMSIRPN